MKYPIILLLIILFSCQKQDSKPVQPTHEVVDYIPIPLGKPGKGNGHGNPNNPPAPEPPPDPTPIPPPSTANNKLLIAFNGYPVNSWHWGVFNAPPSLMTASQQTEAMTFAAALFAPYKIDLTTDVNVYNATDPSRRGIIIVTDSLMRGMATGVATVGGFGTADNIAFVFSKNLNNVPKWTADIIAHEAGHTLGLYHQTDCVNGVVTNQYRNSVIMGSPYYAYPATWTTGTTYSCSVIQNDHEILQSKLGLR